MQICKLSIYCTDLSSLSDVENEFLSLYLHKENDTSTRILRPTCVHNPNLGQMFDLRGRGLDMAQFTVRKLAPIKSLYDCVVIFVKKKNLFKKSNNKYCVDQFGSHASC